MWKIMEFGVSVTYGSLRRSFFIAANAVFKPSPTSLFGGLGKFLIRRTIFPLRAAWFSRKFWEVTSAGKLPGALNFDAVVEDADLKCRLDAVVSMWPPHS